MDNNSYNPTPGVTEQSLLKRVVIFLEDGDFSRADEYCERVLDINVENGEAYLFKLLASLGFAKKEQLFDLDEPFDSEPLYAKIMRFGSDELKKEVEGINLSIIARNEEKARLLRYEKAVCEKDTESITELTGVCGVFRSLGEYKDSPALLKECIRKGEELYDEKYNSLFLYIKDLEQQISDIKYHVSTDLAEKEGYDEYISENRGRKVFDYSKLIVAGIVSVGVLITVMLTLPFFEGDFGFATVIGGLASRTAPTLLITAVLSFISFKVSKLLIKKQKSNLLADVTTAAQRARELTEEIRQNESEELFLKKELDANLERLRKLNEEYDLFTEANEKKEPVNT